MESPAFYECEVCGNLIEIIFDSGASIECCGQPMTRVWPKLLENGAEKHIPVIKISGSKADVTVGEIPHPMTAEHKIMWILLQTDRGFLRAELPPIGKPQAQFQLAPGEVPLKIYAYCNIHGLWVNELLE